MRFGNGAGVAAGTGDLAWLGSARLALQFARHGDCDDRKHDAICISAIIFSKVNPINWSFISDRSSKDILDCYHQTNLIFRLVLSIVRELVPVSLPVIARLWNV